MSKEQTKDNNIENDFQSQEVENDTIENQDEIAENGFGINNPAHLAVGNVVSAVTNVPLDRVVRKVNNLKEAADNEHAAWQRIAMSLGWSTWDVGINPYDKKKSKFQTKNPFKGKKKNKMKTKNPFKKN